jgi:hypothetical protein
MPTFEHLYGVARLRRAPVAKAKSRYAEDYFTTRGMCGLAPIVKCRLPSVGQVLTLVGVAIWLPGPFRGGVFAKRSH